MSKKETEPNLLHGINTPDQAFVRFKRLGRKIRVRTRYGEPTNELEEERRILDKFLSKDKQGWKSLEDIKREEARKGVLTKNI